jgi:hypothetical protein
MLRYPLFQTQFDRGDQQLITKVRIN